MWKKLTRFCPVPSMPIKEIRSFPGRDGWNRFGHKTAVPPRETVYTGSRKDGRPGKSIFWWTAIILFCLGGVKSLAESNIDGREAALQDILCNYQGMVHSQVIVVFDAYRVQGQYNRSA